MMEILNSARQVVAESVATVALALCATWGGVAHCEDWDAVARLLAGMPGQGFDSVRAQRCWAEHAAEMDKAWMRFQGGRMAKIRSWSTAEMGDIHGRCGTIFYPFSGPDLAHVVAFFPRAKTYVLCALEPVSPPPDLSAMSGGEWAVALAAMRAPMLTAINYTYFITKDMRRDFARSALKGNLPPLLSFAARLGLRVDSVESVTLDDDGSPVVAPGWTGASPRGVRLRVRRGTGSSDVYYFSADLGNGALGRDGRLSRFLSALGSRATFMKSASYLMHEGSFSGVRALVLDGSAAILQDDSGIPLSGLDPRWWDLRFYGNYRGTLDMFRQYYQPALREIFESGGARVRPLDFGVGYKFSPDDTVLMLARRRAGDAPPRAERVP
ncbi:MAG TPA: hypothetical protein PLU30_10110 [Verrucomicrobiae bacterium]|nr:hypothetical protein [Verrucomicrobiae bacterium]